MDTDVYRIILLETRRIAWEFFKAFWLPILIGLFIAVLYKLWRLITFADVPEIVAWWPELSTGDLNWK